MKSSGTSRLSLRRMLPAAAISAASARSSSVPGRSAAMALSLGARAPRSRLAFLKPQLLECQALKRQVVKRQIFRRQVFKREVLDPQVFPTWAALQVRSLARDGADCLS